MSGLSVITRIIIRRRQESQSQKKKKKVRGREKELTLSLPSLSKSKNLGVGQTSLAIKKLRALSEQEGPRLYGDCK